ncbi:Arginase/deacetylase [Delitschia confertaspora ATCC 74209]|uniref:Arginase/deacetylase n=1 Tax=Delitschia confertaspora ATCC 74209 TaxID=1513339 RepID=A0A9P4MVV2_9PLEO|nr:Arginase/deacetylase [Delitschia confertaspora ATCC 74209]
MRLGWQRLSIRTASNTPHPTSPVPSSPRFISNPFSSSSPGLPPTPGRRSSSVMSFSRSGTPAMRRKSSNQSLRADGPGTPRITSSRRPSFNPSPATPLLPRSPLPPPMEEKPPLRACDIADECFSKEIGIHHGPESTTTSGTVVIVHDQCYGHRFSRPNSNKSTLSMIVERPERILASVLGISSAYVLLGGRHSEGNNAPEVGERLSERIPFKILKTSRVVDITSPVVTNVHGVKWMEELKTMCLSAEKKLAANGKELSREGHSVKEQLHEGDLYLCPESLNAFQGALGGVLDAVDAVFQGTSTGAGPSRAFACVRPPGHHCSADFPSGFCWINNVHIGIEHAALAHGLTHAAIIDFDLHHGDGSQAITWTRNKKVAKAAKNVAASKKTSIGYFSLHDINSYPCEWGEDDKVQAASLCIDNAHGQSIWNVHLQTWKSKDEFWKLYEDKYLVLLEKARQYLKHHTLRLLDSSRAAPKAAIFVSAGFDASEWESQGMQRHKVNVPTEFYARFTRDVVRLAEEGGTGVDGRVISVLEGGYSDRALTSGVLSHISGLTDGQVRTTSTTSEKGLGHEIGPRVGNLSLDDEAISPTTKTEETFVAYSPEWWSESRLSELEGYVNPPPAVVPKKPRMVMLPNFSSPTQSFTAKVVDPSKVHRTVSGKWVSASPSRVGTPSPPIVDWATASIALSKLLIPSDLRVKKEKPVPVLVQVPTSGRQLRGKKTVNTYVEPVSKVGAAASRPESRANRRKTIADLPLATTEAPATRIGSGGGERSSVAPTQSVANGPQARKPRATAATAPPSAYAHETQNVSQTKVPLDDMEKLTSDLKRVNLNPLKWAHREEEKARDEAKSEASKKKTAAKTTVGRKPPVPRPPRATGMAAKKPVKGSKPSKPTSSAEMVLDAAITPPEQPKIELVSNAPVEQPQPVQPALILNPHQITVLQRQSSGAPIDPSMELTELDFSPEQLPKTMFTTSVKPLEMVTSPPRLDTPPPPPPATIPQLHSYTSYTLGNKSSILEVVMSSGSTPRAPLEEMQSQRSNANMEQAAPGMPLSPSSKPQDLPRWTANGVIPFAPRPDGASVAAVSREDQDRAVDETKDSVVADQDDISVVQEDIWAVPDTPAR